MKANDLRKMTASDLRKELSDLLNEQFKMRMQRGSGQPVKPQLIKQMRRDVARIKTVLKEKAGQGEKVE